MREALTVQIVDALEDLAEVVAGQALAEGAFLCNVREHFSAIDELLSDKGHFLNFSARLVPSGSLHELIVFHEVFVLNLLDNPDFFPQLLNECLLLLNLAHIDEFDRVATALVILRCFDLGAETKSERLPQHVSIYCRCHLIISVVKQVK